MAFTQTRNQILLKAYKRVGIGEPTGAQYQEAGELLNIEVNAVQTEAKHAFLWKTNERIWAIPPSDTCKKSGRFFRCIQTHTSTLDTHPIDGGFKDLYWFEIPEAPPVTWVEDKVYAANNDFTLTNDVVDLDSVIIRTSSGRQYPLELLSPRAFSLLDKTYREARPTKAYFTKNGDITTGNTTPILRFDTHFSDLTEFIVTREILNITEAEDNATPLDAIKRAYKFLLAAVAFQLSFEHDPDMTSVLEKQYEKEKKILIHVYRETGDTNFITPYFPGYIGRRG